MSAGFDARALDKDYAYLDECPEAVFGDVVALPLGSLRERVAGARAWRDALLDGRLPPPETWPGLPVASPVRAALEEMDLARFCAGEEELTDALLRDVLASFGRQADAIEEDVLARLRELEELERLRLREEAPKAKPRALGAALVERLRERARREVEERDFGTDDVIGAVWGERARAWATISEVFGDLGQMLGRGWDLCRNVLRHAGWLDVFRLRELVERLPQLQEVVRALGRLHAGEGEPSVAEQIMAPVRRLEEEHLEVRSRLVPAETRGIERSGDISRMLPLEAMALGHPKLQLAWHARRAERALMTYRVEGMEIERRTVERETLEEVTAERPRPERGPILAVIDTSGSMHGLPEQIAKAVVLEALRVAHAERRKCVLFAFSGPGQVVEHALDLSAEGIGELLAFLGFSFGGGTDIGALHSAVARLEEADWRKADVLLVSDGEWTAPASVLRAVAAAREEGTRFHGVQIGQRGRTGLHEVCDPVHLFDDWAAIARMR